MEYGKTKHFSHSIVDVFVDGVECDRSLTNVFVTSTQQFGEHLRCASSSCPHCMWGPVPRWLKAWSMFWLLDAEMVIDDRPNEPVLTTAGTWRTRKDSMEVRIGRTWHYHGMDDKAMRTRTYILQKCWLDQISVKKKTAAEVIYRQMHQPYQRPRSPIR